MPDDDSEPADDDSGATGPDDDSGPDSSDPAPDQPADPDEPAWAGRPACHERGKCGTRSSHHHRPDFGRRQCDPPAHRVDRADQADRADRPHHRTIHIDRSNDRSEHRRRSAVTERPHNVRPARVLERSYTNNGYHSRRPVPEVRNPESRADDNQIANRSYHGSHRAGGQHHVDWPTQAEQRSSRMGRHHADQQDTNFNR